LYDLHANCNVGELGEFVDHDCLSVDPFSKDDPLLGHILDGMEFLNKNVAINYKILSVKNISITNLV
jgi:hypothetical protein